MVAEAIVDPAATIVTGGCSGGAAGTEPLLGDPPHDCPPGNSIGRGPAQATGGAPNGMGCILQQKMTCIG